MTKTLSVMRTEKKYEITRIQESTLIDRLSSIMKLDTYGSIEGYRVRSLYFDSIYDNDYFDKINGLERRKKIRLRIYTWNQKEVKLELKEKTGSNQKKRSLLISRELAEELVKGNYKGLLDIGTELATEFYLTMETGLYRPKCIVEYTRIAFVENTNNTRITFDSNIGASNLCDEFFKENLALFPVRTEPILEVKYNGFLLSNIKQIVDFANTSEISISKYTMSRELFGV